MVICRQNCRQSEIIICQRGKLCTFLNWQQTQSKWTIYK